MNSILFEVKRAGLNFQLCVCQYKKNKDYSWKIKCFTCKDSNLEKVASSLSHPSSYGYFIVFSNRKKSSSSGRLWSQGAWVSI